MKKSFIIISQFNSLANGRVEENLPQSKPFSTLDTSQNPEHPLIEKLLESRELRGWERLFISTMRECPKPGARQMRKVKAIATRLGINEGDEA